ncbi:hypothetical protein [Marilutibacter chinensis]|uniref:hypothetical protein n=1 Tax=Marilutibacter chinensis TaxID=2912247 RepID=UPI001F27ED60|nr:hypothetical protein [Lysobacter chinensis]
MRSAYPFFNRYRQRLTLVAMAVQEPTLSYVDPQDGETFSRDEFVGFARDYLGVEIIFRSPAAPWLQQDRAPQPPRQPPAFAPEFRVRARAIGAKLGLTRCNGLMPDIDVDELLQGTGAGAARFYSSTA